MTLYNILDHGATAEPGHLNTLAIQKTIDLAASAGGGVVQVPAGTYLTGTIVLKSNITLDLAPGAVLMGSTRLDDYTRFRWGHHKDRTPYHLIYAEDAENIAITGRGTIDGQGHAFWKEGRKHDWAFYLENYYRPSPMVEITGCRNIVIESINLRRSAGWTLHLHDCESARIRSIHIRNTKFGPNTDGIDITGGRNIIISDCDIETGDDAIALKTTEDSTSCEYVTVTNCILDTNCIAFRIGYESRQDFRYITFSNCVVKNCSRGIDLRSIEGCVIENVNISDVVMVNNSGWPFQSPIEIELNRYANACTMPAELTDHPNCGVDKPVEKIGAIRNIHISNCDLTTDGRIMLASADDGQLENIFISDIRLHYPFLEDPVELGKIEKTGCSFFSDMPKLRGVRSAIVASNIKNLRVSEIHIDWPQYPVPSWWNLFRSEQIACNKVFDAPEGVSKENHLKEFVEGDRVPPFHVLWGEKLAGGKIEMRGAKSNSTETSPYHFENSTCDVVG